MLPPPEAVAPRRAVLRRLSALVLATPALHVPPSEATSAAGSILEVGPNRRFPTIAAAIAAARDGDTLMVQPGTYVDDFAMIGVRVTIRSAGRDLVRLLAVASPPNRKAILVVDTDLTIEGVAFSGAAVPNLNGAGIRYQGGRLTLRRCHFHGNQMNLLAAARPDGAIAIEACEFGPTVVTASLSHSLYVNGVGELRVRDSLFHGAATGHQIKSRALRTTITGCRITEGDGRGSYSVDLPNGGQAVLSGNLIEQGPHSQNPAIVHFGGEGQPYPGSTLRIAGNTFVNRLASPGARLLRNQTEAVARLEDNRVFGLDAAQLAEGPAEVSGTVWLDRPPVLEKTPPWARPPAGRG